MKNDIFLQLPKEAFYRISVHLA